MDGVVWWWLRGGHGGSGSGGPVSPDWPPELLAQLELLPPDIKKLVATLPATKAKKVLAQLIQQTELDYRELEEEDIETIKVRPINLIII